ncbi:MAG: glycosyl transferase [Bacteroidetes bacterium HGW-Bacteroidetes-17]|nr:MAG: glycosyl transferase [Bacteroidetes bacterium HGW-Bacteroidetes-17]
MFAQPKISFITVVYNSESFLEDTLKSVINQTYTNKEIIIIDGGSNDGTMDIIKKFTSNIDFWISEPDKGLYDAMNKGLVAATGDYVTFINSGDAYCDIYVIDKLFDEQTNADIIYGDINVIDPKNGGLRYQKALEFNLPTLLDRGTGVVCHQAIFVKRLIAPFYNIKLKYKAELNWYFDIVESKTHISTVHKAVAVVNYSLGGFGYKNFWKNQFEWFVLIIKRFGLRVFFQYKYPQKISQRFQYRYPELSHKLKRFKNKLHFNF